MAYWKLKGCPRCSGDILVDCDDTGPIEGCLQCGYQHYLPDTESAEPRKSTPAIEIVARPQYIVPELSSTESRR